MTDRPRYSRGCFGSPILFKEDDTCAACPHFAECRVVHLKAKQQIQQLYGVKVKSPTRVAGQLPAKVERLKQELGKTEQEVRDAMMNGENPYRVKDGFVGIICQLIISTGTISRPLLEEALAKYRKLGRSTASAYTRRALQLLSHCGAIRVEGENVTLLRG